MAKNLADRLESLSGYRHVFPPNDPQSNLNPIVFSHLRITVGGKPYHVLSRICAAGLDYTQRSNKFAHHIVLDQSELVPAGPAAVLAAPGFMESRWEGEPRTIGIGRQPPSIDVRPVVCQHWQSVTGDAGWAGVLAQTAANGSSEVCTVIFQPGIDALSLVGEALALLRAPLRWQVTFSTYFTKLPPEVRCQWRFVLQGSPEAKAVEKSPHTPVIDLTTGTAVPPNGPWVDAARTGRPPVMRETARVTADSAIAPMAEPIGPVESKKIANQSYKVDWQRAPRSTKVAFGMPRMPDSGLSASRSHRRIRRLWMIAASAAAVVLLSTGTYVAVTRLAPDLASGFLNRYDRGHKVPHQTSQTSKEASHSSDQDERTVTPRADKQSGPPPSDQSKRNTEKAERHDPDETPEPEDGLAPQRNHEDSEEEREVPNVSAELAFPEFFDVEKAPLPRLGEQVRALVGSVKNAPLAECQLELLGGDEVLSDGWEFVLEHPKKEAESDIPILLRKRNARVFHNRVPIATIHRGQNTVHFSRKRIEGSDTRRRAPQLSNCVLKISCHEATKLIALREPETNLEPIRISFDSIETIVPLPSVTHWPMLQVVLEVPDEVRQEPALAQYSIIQNGSNEVIMQSADNDMPRFSLAVDTQRHLVQMRSDWKLLGQPNGDSNWLDGELKKLGKDKEQLEEEHNTRTRRLDDFEREGQSQKKINDATQNIKNTEEKQQQNQEKIKIAEKMSKIERSRIPYRIVVYIDGHRVVIASSELP